MICLRFTYQGNIIASVTHWTGPPSTDYINNNDTWLQEGKVENIEHVGGGCRGCPVVRLE